MKIQTSLSSLLSVFLRGLGGLPVCARKPRAVEVIAVVHVGQPPGLVQGDKKRSNWVDQMEDIWCSISNPIPTSLSLSHTHAHTPTHTHTFKAGLPILYTENFNPVFISTSSYLREILRLWNFSITCIVFWGTFFKSVKVSVNPGLVIQHVQILEPPLRTSWKDSSSTDFSGMPLRFSQFQMRSRNAYLGLLLLLLLIP